MNLDPYRLPRTILPRRYEVTLEPELAAATFSGDVRIDIDVTERVEQIVMNAIELDIKAVTVDGAVVAFSLDEDTERLFIEAPLEPGSASVSISFDGVLND